MREGVRDDTCQTPPLRFERSAIECHRLIEAARPFARRHFGHTAEQTFFGARARQDKAIRAHYDKRSAAAQRAGLLLGFTREALLIAARACGTRDHPWAEGAGGILRRTDRGAQVHHGLREIAGAARR